MEYPFQTSRETEIEEFIAAKSISGSGTCPDFALSLFYKNEAADETMMPQLLTLRAFGKMDVLVLDTPATNIVYGPYLIVDTAEESPFDELDDKQTTGEKINRLIDFVRQGSRLKFANELAAQLDFLNEAVNEDPEEDSISIDSMRNFINFLQNTANLKCPSIALTPSNEIHAQWRTAPNRHFAAVFLPTGEARFVIFTPNAKEPEMIDRISGLTSVDSLLETIRPHNVLKWASI